MSSPQQVAPYQAPVQGQLQQGLQQQAQHHQLGSMPSHNLASGAASGSTMPQSAAYGTSATHSAVFPYVGCDRPTTYAVGGQRPPVPATPQQQQQQQQQHSAAAPHSAHSHASSTCTAQAHPQSCSRTDDGSQWLSPDGQARLARGSNAGVDELDELENIGADLDHLSVLARTDGDAFHSSLQSLGFVSPESRSCLRQVLADRVITDPVQRAAVAQREADRAAWRAPVEN